VECRWRLLETRKARMLHPARLSAVFGFCDWLNCRKLNSFLVEKVASGRDVTLAPWTGEWHDTPEPPLAAASQSA